MGFDRWQVTFFLQLKKVTKKSRPKSQATMQSAHSGAFVSCALGQDARKYDHKDVGGRVAPGAATENNAGRCLWKNKCLERAGIARKDSVVEQPHKLRLTKVPLCAFSFYIVVWGDVIHNLSILNTVCVITHSKFACHLGNCSCVALLPTSM